MIGKEETTEISRLFGYPCDYSEPEETMHNGNCRWCEKNCGEATADKCWHKYFEIIRRNNDERKNS